MLGSCLQYINLLNGMSTHFDTNVTLRYL